MKFRSHLDPARRATSGRRQGWRPALERLESRRLLSQIVWNGDGDGTSFDDAANWVGGKLPGASDDAVINLQNATATDVVLPAGGATVNTFTQTGGSLTMNSGAFTTVQGSFSLTDVTFNNNGGTILAQTLDGTGSTLDGGTLNDGLNASAGFNLSLEGICTLNGPVNAGESLDVTVPTNQFSASLTVASGFVNKGFITLGAANVMGTPLPVIMTVAGGATFFNYGSLSTTFNTTLVGKFSNEGIFGANATITTLSAGSSIVNEPGGTLVMFSLPPCTFDDSQPGASIVNEPGGTMKCWGYGSDPSNIETSPGSFVNEGTLDVENAGSGISASFTVDGNYTQTSTGSLNVDLSGTIPDDEYSQLIVTGVASLAGSLGVTLGNQYVPGTNTSFEVMTYGSATGNFTSYNGLFLSNGLTLVPIFAATSLTLTTGPAPEADLSVAVAASASQLTLGGNLTYTVTLANHGPNDAQQVALTDTLPANASVVSVTASAGSLMTVNGIVTLDLATFTSGGTDILTIVVTPTMAGTFADSASVTDLTPFDPNLNNNQASVSSTVTPVLKADLVASVSAPPATTTGQFTITASVHNSGPNPALATTLTDTFTLPKGAQLAAESLPQGTVKVSGNVVTATIGTLPSGSTVALTVTIVTIAAGSFTQTAVASSSTFDPNMANNTATAGATVLGQDTLTLTPSSNSIGLKTPVTLNARVIVPLDFAAATKSVTFYDGTTSLGTASLNASGQASLVVPSLPKGVDSLSAAYSGDSTEAASNATATVRVGEAVSGDYDGSGKTDVAVFDQTTDTFSITYANGTVHTQHIGKPADTTRPVVGDFDGDGKTDLAIYDQTLAEFLILDSGGGSLALPFGSAKDINIPVAGDFDGDGKTDLAIYDQTLAEFLVLDSGGGTIAQQFGSAKDVNVPVAGDFDGDGKTDIAIYDQTNATFYILESGGGSRVQQLGNVKHVNLPIAGDYDGDGKTDLAIYDQTAGELFALESGGGTIALPFGNAADVNLPIAGDYDGDGKTDLAIYDPVQAEYFVILSDGGSLVEAMGNTKHKNVPV